MNPHLIIIALLAIALGLTSCYDLVPLTYPRAEAAAEPLFARGWLPEIIPASSRQINMRNDLDINESIGEFKFDPSHHDQFVAQLQRIPSEDTAGFSAYRFQEWTFWIGHDKNQCKFHMRFNHRESQL